ncbi:hypothetical protein [Nocardiopsis alkaliphila]|uniref:hypothetical protein n=1 Tax=Nocardiopsis alkaliphila TaxID=225762 RepID=UPI0004774154|nr:hypothetical protein [Nocardiopsis alkaliphila]
MDDAKKNLENLMREELGDEPSQEAKDYARRLYERFRLPATDPAANGVAPAASSASTPEPAGAQADSTASEPEESSTTP